MQQLSEVPGTGFDAVLCADNALPHVSCDEHLVEAATQIRAKPRPGGILVASIRDCDRLIDQ